MTKRYEYDFVKVDMKGFATAKPTQDWQAIVKDYAAQGWRLQQIFSPPVTGYGSAQWFELIFEREI